MLRRIETHSGIEIGAWLVQPFDRRSWTAHFGGGCVELVLIWYVWTLKSNEMLQVMEAAAFAFTLPAARLNVTHCGLAPSQRAGLLQCQSGSQLSASYRGAWVPAAKS